MIKSTKLAYPANRSRQVFKHGTWARRVKGGSARVYAIIETGGKQVRVQSGSYIDVELLSALVDQPVVFDRVLMVVGDDGSCKVGTPFVEGATVRGTVVQHGRGPKILVFKYKPKVNYRRRMGHRQPFTRVQIEQIEG